VPARPLLQPPVQPTQRIPLLLIPVEDPAHVLQHADYGAVAGQCRYDRREREPAIHQDIVGIDFSVKKFSIFKLLTYNFPKVGKLSKYSLEHFPYPDMAAMGAVIATFTSWFAVHGTCFLFKSGEGPAG
jgi:hypothetical protein